MTVTMTRPAAGARGCARSDSLEFGASPGSVAVARLHARVVLGEWGLSELAADATQVVSELMTNAIEAHRREQLDAPVRLTLLAGPRAVLIVVRDAAAGRPEPGNPGDISEHGRGLLIVEALAARWDCKRCPDGGKAVRALVR